MNVKTLPNRPIWPSAKMICQNCGQRNGTHIWSEGAMAYVHGAYQMWCQHCVLEAQLAHALEMVEKIPIMELELERLKADGA